MARPTDGSEPAFVGSVACGDCHKSEMAAWRGSHHDLAMQEATDSTVLGDFDDASYSYGGITSRFFRRDGKFFANTDGPDGKLADFEIRYTFGVYPLQQYLIAFPDGRMQALGIAWDRRPKDKGGQRWFHLYPDQKLKPGNPLHWTGLDQTWNFMCAECHSTELRKNYDAAKNTYATTWTEIDVACEACHGPGSAHAAWAERQKNALPRGRGGDNGLTVHFDERKDISWSIDPTTGIARRSTPRTSAKELETCGICHSRSAKIAEPWRPGQSLLETHLPSLLQPGLFEADGKMLDEVYNYVPFRQSKMFVAGVSCSDCHDPHSLKLVADGNAVCMQCHDGQKYAAALHHHHKDGSTDARCVACHMPVKTYMQVDARHDHAFRVPRPDESVRFGTSNACNDCHTDKDAAWAAAAVERWFGPGRKGFQTWTETFAAARAGKVEAAALLLKLATSPAAPSIARATAFESLAEHPSREAVAAAGQGLADTDPLVRLAALRTLRPFPVQQSWPLASRLLADPVLGVRIEAVSLLAAMPQDRLPPTDRERLSRASDEYVKAQRVNADRPESRGNLGNLYAQQGRSAEAEAAYAAACALDPSFTPTYVSLAQLYAQQGRDGDGERALREALTRMPDDAELHLSASIWCGSTVRTTLFRRSHGLPRSTRATCVTPTSTRWRSTRPAVRRTPSRPSKPAMPAIRRTATRCWPWSPSTATPGATPLHSLGPTVCLATVDPSAKPLVDQLRQTAPSR